ncbi:MAG: PH domain-containing protein, partial [Gemmatimonadaceae bacterium]
FSNETMIYKSSRLTSGNRIFRTSLDVEGHQITYRKSRWLGSTEETINVDHISSVRAQHGLMFSSITIESSGGSQPIVITGLSKGDAREIEAAIKAAQPQQRS